MKKIFIISLLALIALVSCKKERTTIEAPESKTPAWVEDESLPVPVLFSSDDLVETKAGPITKDDFYNVNNPFYYGITAIDVYRAYDSQNPTQNRLFKTLGRSNSTTKGNYAIAKNVLSGDLTLVDEQLDLWDGSDDDVLKNSSNGYLTQFGTLSGTGYNVFTPTTYYYPLQSTYKDGNGDSHNCNFLFFGYRTNEENIFDLTWETTGTDAGNAFVKDITIGHQDILWGESAIPAYFAGTGGYNAKYIRKAWEAANDDAEVFYRDYAPRMHFNHVTTAFQFVVKTDPGRRNFGTPSYDYDEAAKKFEDANIYIKEMSLTGVSVKADLKVTASDDVIAWDEDAGYPRLPKSIDATKILSKKGNLNTATTDLLKVDSVICPTVTRSIRINKLYFDKAKVPANASEVASFAKTTSSTSKLYGVTNPVANTPIASSYYYSSNPASVAADIETGKVPELVPTTVSSSYRVSTNGTTPNYYYAIDPSTVDADHPQSYTSTQTDYPYWPNIETEFRWDKFYPQFNYDGESYETLADLKEHGDGNEYGDPLLVLPSSVDTQADPVLHITFHLSGTEGVTTGPDAEQVETIEVPLKGSKVEQETITEFQVGKKYIFTILVHSPEEIEVVTTLAEWDEIEVDQIEIE